ncbi:cyclic nucleotide-binding domain-containing protein [Streptomyces mangrovisoli]|uniref:Regulator n=1 Tax=Streptomyces mangrovisoli TaxID=1428628 RepID=A0A1J4P1Q3_9ACTN|nr:cyclic nucleotide-binding domain-containing protein [Streptomyces mangrovisoli]OIJ68681.1 regulator [Streptomyces mangrovisoli]
MNAPTTTTRAQALPAGQLRRLMALAREVSFPAGTRLFEEGGHADRFWIVRTGTVDLDLRVGRRAAVIESLRHNELVGWSWLYAPHVRHLGAEAASPVRAYEFDADAVRRMCAEDPEFGRDVSQWVGGVVAHRLQAARTRLLDLYHPYGSGGPR